MTLHVASQKIRIMLSAQIAIGHSKAAKQLGMSYKRARTRSAYGSF